MYNIFERFLTVIQNVNMLLYDLSGIKLALVYSRLIKEGIEVIP